VYNLGGQCWKVLVVFHKSLAYFVLMLGNARTNTHQRGNEKFSRISFANKCFYN
jgi:hypothetical protein